jgi:hypothetical protein
MTGSGKTGFFSDFHPVDRVLDNACLSGFCAVSRANYVHSHRVTLSRSTTHPQSSFTAPLRAPVSTMAWLGLSIRTQAHRLATKNSGQGIVHTCSTPASLSHPSHPHHQLPQDRISLRYLTPLLQSLLRVRRTMISQQELSLVLLLVL